MFDMLLGEFVAVEVECFEFANMWRMNELFKGGW